MVLGEGIAVQVRPRAQAVNRRRQIILGEAVAFRLRLKDVRHGAAVRGDVARPVPARAQEPVEELAVGALRPALCQRREADIDMHQGHSVDSPWGLH